MRRVLVLAVALSALSLVTVSGGGATQSHDVAVRDFAFRPGRITVAKGDTLRWTNQDNVAHTTTSDSAWWSRHLDPGETYAMTVTLEEGLYRYRCTVHPSRMTGEVEVVKDLPTPRPTATPTPTPVHTTVPQPSPTPQNTGSCTLRDEAILRVSGFYLAPDGLWREANALTGLQRDVTFCRGVVVAPDAAVLTLSG